MFDLTGKTALVTGSSRGIGRAIALALASAGARVVFHGSAPSENLASAVAQAGHGSDSVCADLGSENEIASLLAELRKKQLKIDILVLNGSTQSYTGIANFSGDEFRRQLRTNMESAFLLLQALLPEMQQRNFGRVIAVSSVNQLRPAARLAVYGTTKAALANLMQVVAKDYAASGITANTIIPGVIATDRNREALKNEAFSDELKKAIPMHRFGTPEDCAPAVVFLASGEASYISGAELPIAGAWQL